MPPPGGPMPPPGGPGMSVGETRPGDWTCAGCGANVFASKNSCFRCRPHPTLAGLHAPHAPQPARPPRPPRPTACTPHNLHARDAVSLPCAPKPP